MNKQQREELSQVQDSLARVAELHFELFSLLHRAMPNSDQRTMTLRDLDQVLMTATGQILHSIRPIAKELSHRAMPHAIEDAVEESGLKTPNAVETLLMECRDKVDVPGAFLRECADQPEQTEIAASITYEQMLAEAGAVFVAMIDRLRGLE